MRLIGILGVASVACRSHVDHRPLREAIVGEWDIWCTTDTEAKARCLGKDDSNLVKTFAADGSVEIRAARRGDPPMIGTWTVNGSNVVLAFAGLSTESYRGRIDDGHL